MHVFVCVCTWVCSCVCTTVYSMHARICVHRRMYVYVLYIPLVEAWHVSCMTIFAAYGAIVVTPEQHKNDGCYS